MPAYVIWSDKAIDNLETLVAERGADNYLLARLEEHLDAVAESPATMTEPAVFPHAKRLMTTVQLDDATARRWNFVVTLRRMPDEEGIYILTVLGGKAPRNFAS